jgi:hypothetical protein
MEWKVWVGGGETGNEVVFECLDGSFGCIAAMYAWRGLLELYVFVMDVVL